MIILSRVNENERNENSNEHINQSNHNADVTKDGDTISKDLAA